MTTRNFSRREIIKTTMGAIGGLSMSGILRAGTPTPAQTEGPFYPKRPPLDRDNDLTLLAGSNQSAKGEIIILAGSIFTEDRKTISGAGIEIWQACASGRYNDPEDTNPAELDPHFQYWGRDFSDAKGRYTFKTLIPGAYPADSDWVRPPHIHFKIYKLGFHELTTQMYFKDEALNAKDKILRALSPEEQNKVVIPLKVDMDGTRTASFDIILRKVV